MRGEHRTGRRLLAVVAGLALVGGLVVLTPTGARAAPSSGSTGRVSVLDDGSQGTQTCPPDDPTGNCFYSYQLANLSASISGDGTAVAFATPVQLDQLATPGVQNVYVRDLTTQHTTLVSVGSADGDPTPANGDSFDPRLSANGRYLVFGTTATNLDDGDDTGGNDYTEEIGDVVFCDLQAGQCTVLGRTDLVSGEEQQREFANSSPTISADGSTVAWSQSTVAYPESGPSPPASADVIARMTPDATGGLQPPAEGTYVDLTVPAVGSSTGYVGPPALSADGEHVAYSVQYESITDSSYAEALPENGTVLFAEDCPLPDNACPRTRTTEVDVDSTGAPLGGSPSDPAISGNGAEIAFAHVDAASDAGDEYPCGTTPSFAQPPQSQVIVVNRDPHDTGTLGPADGAPVAESIASLDDTGQPGQGCSDWPALSSDGRYLAFDTTAPNLDDGTSTEEDNTDSRVVQRDLVVDGQRQQAGLSRLPGELASPDDTPGCQALAESGSSPTASSVFPSLTANGGMVSFVSCASGLIADDTNDLPDTFVRTYLPTITAAPLTFGTVAQGATAQGTVTVSQNGFGPVTIGSLSISGPDAGDFTVFPEQSCAGATLYETGECLVAIRYAPSGPGTRTATLTIGAPTPISVALSGGAGPPIDGFTATPNPLAFPGQRLTLTSSTPRAITVGNGSAAPFTITGVSLPSGPGLYPGDYVITSDGCLGATLAPGASCQVLVLDMPQGPGSRPAALAFTDTTGGSPQLVGLSATATTPTLRLSPDVTPGGRVATVFGAGFPANYPVTVGIPGEPAAPTVSAVTDASGAFSAGLPVFQDADVGSWPVVASAVGLGLTAQVPLLIVLGTEQPPDFVTRN